MLPLIGFLAVRYALKVAGSLERAAKQRQQDAELATRERERQRQATDPIYQAQKQEVLRLRVIAEQQELRRKAIAEEARHRVEIRSQDARREALQVARQRQEMIEATANILALFFWIASGVCVVCGLANHRHIAMFIELAAGCIFMGIIIKIFPWRWLTRS